MKKIIVLTICMFVLSVSLSAMKNMPKQPKVVTYEEVTSQMVTSLNLDAKQQKKVAKLNKKYKKLIEGEMPQLPGGAMPSADQQGQRPPMGGGPGGMPGGGMGGPDGAMPAMGGGMPGGGFGGRGGGMTGGGQRSVSSYDYDKQQKKYDKAIAKILSEQQYEGYLQIKPQFASQRRVRDFLFGDNGAHNDSQRKLLE